MMITQEELKSLLEYNPETGLWKWKTSGRGRKRGWFRGTLAGKGYPTITVNKETCRASSLAWLYMYGELVKGLDHSNRNKQDNRINNLRKATISQNRMNSFTQANNASGHTGVRYKPRDKKWEGTITKAGVTVTKYFLTKEQTIAWRKEMESSLFGKFAPIRLEEGDGDQI